MPLPHHWTSLGVLSYPPLLIKVYRPMADSVQKLSLTKYSHFSTLLSQWPPQNLSRLRFMERYTPAISSFEVSYRNHVRRMSRAQVIGGLYSGLVLSKRPKVIQQSSIEMTRNLLFSSVTWWLPGDWKQKKRNKFKSCLVRKDMLKA